MFNAGGYHVLKQKKKSLKRATVSMTEEEAYNQHLRENEERNVNPAKP